MRGTTTQIGRYGEALAAAHLIGQGFTVTRRNYRAGHNEIDLIVENEDYILFVEVKTRSTVGPDIKSQYGRPSRAVTYDKQKRTLDAARVYLHSHPTSKRPRMDVIELYLKQDDSAAPTLLKLEWIQNAYRKQSRFPKGTL